MARRRRTYLIAVALGVIGLLALAAPSSLLLAQLAARARGAPLAWQQVDNQGSPTFYVPPGWKLSHYCYGWTSPRQLTLCAPGTLGERPCAKSFVSWRAAAGVVHALSTRTNPKGFVDAEDAATFYARMFAAAMFQNLAGEAPELAPDGPRAMPLDSVTEVSAAVRATAAGSDACTPSAGVVRAVALPSVQDGFDVLVVEATRGAVPDRDLDQIVHSLRC